MKEGGTVIILLTLLAGALLPRLTTSPAGKPSAGKPSQTPLQTIINLFNPQPQNGSGGGDGSGGGGGGTPSEIEPTFNVLNPYAPNPIPVQPGYGIFPSGNLSSPPLTLPLGGSDNVTAQQYSPSYFGSTEEFMHYLEGQGVPTSYTPEPVYYAEPVLDAEPVLEGQGVPTSYTPEPVYYVLNESPFLGYGEDFGDYYVDMREFENIAEE